ncbi:MAG: aminopeptidase P N-terminal domain-containing protein [Fibrobacteres bacterium]|nr:aminopeptidase P N-terminal domain-containing protein [Fibrobacterota bacterium]
MIRSKDLLPLSRVYVTGLAGLRARDHFQRRRQEHLEAAAFPWIFHGLEKEPGADLHWLMNGVRIFQEPSVQYLTGINQPGATLVLDPTAKGAAKQTLFLPWKDPSREFWDGIRLGLEKGRDARASLEHLRELLGIDRILPADDLPAFLSALATRHAQLGVFHQSYPNGQSLSDDPSNRFASLVKKLAKPHGSKVVSIATEHLALRLPLDSWQIAECERAQDWTRDSFLELLPQLPSLATEHAIAGTLEGSMLRRSSFGLAFPTICAAGANAAVLHYMKNDEPVTPGSMVLLDFGCRSASMHADISRTLPANGRFDPLHRMLYGIVLSAQEYAQSLVRPGITIRELNKLVWQRLEDLLEDQFLSKGGTMVRPYAEGKLSTMPGKAKAHPRQPHGLSHLMGEQEHDGDPFRLYQDQPLRPGLLISNEPGLYGRFRIRLAGRTHESTLGIRIEDDLLLTAKGCRNLSTGLPKDPDALENLIGVSR